MIRLLAHPLPPSSVNNLSIFLSLSKWFAGRAYGCGDWVGEELNHTTAEKAWPSLNHQYSLVLPIHGSVLAVES
jgi:hypothetical protein